MIPKLSISAWVSWQTMVGLIPDGIAGPITLTGYYADQAVAQVPELYFSFHGSLALLVQEEGFKGYLYWPGFSSGATLDFGFDLSWQLYSQVSALYGHLWATERLRPFCAPGRGVRGPHGKSALDRLEALKACSSTSEQPFPLTRNQAAQILPHAVLPYWSECLRLWPDLQNAPSQFQTAFLSVCYSTWSEPVSRARDAFNETQGDPISAVAHEIRKSPGHGPRREREALLIESVR